MATEKLAEGIRLFAADAVKLEKLVESWPPGLTTGAGRHSPCWRRQHEVRGGVQRRRPWIDHDHERPVLLAMPGSAAAGYTSPDVPTTRHRSQVSAACSAR